MGPTEPLTWGMLKALIQREGVTSNDLVGEFTIRGDQALEIVLENGPFGRTFSLKSCGVSQPPGRPLVDERTGGSD